MDQEGGKLEGSPFHVFHIIYWTSSSRDENLRPTLKGTFRTETFSRLVDRLRLLGFSSAALLCTLVIDGAEFEASVRSQSCVDEARKRFAQIIADRQGREGDENCWIYVTPHT